MYIKVRASVLCLEASSATAPPPGGKAMVLTLTVSSLSPFASVPQLHAGGLCAAPHRPYIPVWASCPQCSSPRSYLVLPSALVSPS